MKRSLIFLLMAGVALLTIVACSDGNFPFPPAKNMAQVMLIHASPDAPGVDAFLDEVLVAENLEYPNSTRYTSLDEGEHNVNLKVTGTDQTVIDAPLDLKGDQYYSIFACGAVAGIAPLVVEDHFLTLRADSAQVRFIHLSPNAPAVDVTLTDGTVLFSNVLFKGATLFQPFAIGRVDLQVRLAGTETVVVELKDVLLAPSVVYTIWAKGFAGGVGEQALGAEIIMNRIKL